MTSISILIFHDVVKWDYQGKKRCGRGETTFAVPMLSCVIAGLLAATGLCAQESLPTVNPWSLPHWRFPNVDNTGQVVLWQPLDEIPLGSVYGIPFGIGFQSGQQSSSPYLGKGWSIPLFESSIYQVDEVSFLLVQPDGKLRHLVRNSPTEDALKDGSGWTAKVADDTITVTAPFGWQLAYEKGKLASFLTPDGEAFHFDRSDTKSSLVGPHGDVLISAEVDPLSGQAVIKGPMGTTTFAQGTRPDIQFIGGQAVVDHLDKGLSSVRLPSGETYAYSYSTDRSLHPSVKESSKTINRTITWDPKTNYILGDDKWSYQITRPDDEETSVKRTDKDGKSESWDLNLEQGIEKVVSTAGIETTTRFFSTGYLVGKVRGTETVSSDKNKTSFKTTSSYDESGNLIRYGKGASYDSYSYDNAGKLKTIQLPNGNKVTKLYDFNGIYMGQEIAYKNGSMIRLLKDTPNTMSLLFSIPKSGLAVLPVNPESAAILFGQDSTPLTNL